jgi:hypothetical protein
MSSSGGEGARLNCFRCEKKDREIWRDDFAFVHVKYWDHVLFKNVELEKILISQREAIGWLVYQDSNVIVLLMDRSCNPQSSEKADLASGLRILRSCITKISDVSPSVLDKLTSSERLDKIRKNKSEEN